ncbi:MAG: preprotein translocase subunit Sec61beta [Euryarchaeota archaeon]|nr:preprotein translocase subunit Sec61beta [Euryarchaeota archaeon]
MFHMAKKKDNSGIQQAAGLIRYFDEESEDALQIPKSAVYFACFAMSIIIYLANHGVWQWIWEKIG